MVAALALGASVPLRFGHPWIALGLAGVTASGAVWVTATRDRAPIDRNVGRARVAMVVSVPLFVLISVITSAPLTLSVTAVPLAIGAELLARRRASFAGPLRDLVRSDRPIAVDVAVGAVVGLGSSAVLWLFFLRHGGGFVLYRNVAPAIVMLGIVAFACANAVSEELIWRWAIIDIGRDLGFHPSSAIVLSAASFSLAHFYGVPWGLEGCVLTLVYGLCLGFLRWATGGLRSGLIAHVVVDVAVGALLLLR